MSSIVNVPSHAQPCPRLLARLSSRANRCRGFRTTTAPRAENASIVKEKWWTKDPQPNLLEATCVEDLVQILQAEKDRLVLVDFFAPWCNACRALYPKLNQLCQQNPHVVVVKVNWEANKAMAKTLGVKVLPYFHAYHGSMGRVASFSSSITKIQRLRDCMNLFGRPYCDLGNVNVKASLPEFDLDDVSVPSDTTKLVYSSEDEDEPAQGVADLK